MLASARLGTQVGIAIKMATILLTWELGGGLGHLVNLKPFADDLSHRGHQVFAALRDSSRIGQVFTADKLILVEAPVLRRRLASHLERPRTFAQILHNCGFGELPVLQSLVSAWVKLLRRVKPDLLVLDHSPAALLATRLLQLPRCLVGTGFFTPPLCSPLPDLRNGLRKPDDSAVGHEELVLRNINTVLAQWGQSSLSQVADLYHQVERNYFTTFAELDHYGIRADSRYVGSWTIPATAKPEWPGPPGKRIFAYLKPVPQIEMLFSAIRRINAAALVYCHGIPSATVSQ